MMNRHFSASLILLSSLALFSNAQFDGSKFGKNAKCRDFKCSKGEEPVPKSPINYLVSKGCDGLGGDAFSMMGGGSQKEVDFILKPCCDLFHSCFQICGSTKSFCTNDFEKCMSNKCEAIKHDGIRKGCEAEVDTKKLMLQMSDCKNYDEGQKRGCRCVKEKNVVDERAKVVRSFYKKNNPKNVDKADALAAKATDKNKFAGLIMKLVGKYPKGIKVIKDPQKQRMEDMMKGYTPPPKAEEGSKTTVEDVVDAEDGDDEESEEDERIEL